MRRIVSAFTLAALLGPVPVQAATDLGLTLHDGPAAHSRSGGVGAQAGVTIRLGDRRTVPAADKVTLGLQAGPVITLRDRTAINGQRQIVGNVLGYTIKPGYSSTLSFGGKPVVRDFTRLGAAEEEGSKEKKKQGTGDKIAWVAAAAGGVMVLLFGAALIAFSSNPDI